MALTLSGIAKLRNAIVVLRETRGFAYLPIIVPHEVAGRDAVDELRNASAVGEGVWHELPWPELAPGEAPAGTKSTPETLAAQRVALLTSFDSFLAHGMASGRTLVLDASPSTRHALAAEVIPYLNQRREPLRTRQHRLILVWPADLSEELRGGAPDLWSQRTVAAVLEAEDFVVPPSENIDSDFRLGVPSRTAPVSLNPVVQAQLAKWFAKHDLRAANLSGADALTLAEVLYGQLDFVELQLLAETIEASFFDNQYLIAQAKAWRSLAMSGRGCRSQALAVQLEVVEIYRHLAQPKQAPFEADLALSLNNLSNRQSETGDRVGALASARESVDIRRRLAQANPSEYLPGLAASLNYLAICQKKTADMSGALGTAREAVEISRRLAQVGAATHEADLALRLNNLANTQRIVGDHAGALATARESVEKYRRLAQASPAVYEPGLAASLNNLGSILSATGDRANGLALAHESTVICRRLAQSAPVVYEPNLASSLTNLANHLSEAGDHAGALITAREAVEVYRRLAQSNPVAFEPDLAGSLLGLAHSFDANKNGLEARNAAQDALNILKPLARSMPEVFEKSLGAAAEALRRFSAIP